MIAFRVTVKREGRVVVDREVLGPDWFTVWNAAIEEHGMECRIEVAPA